MCSQHLFQVFFGGVDEKVDEHVPGRIWVRVGAVADDKALEASYPKGKAFLTHNSPYDMRQY
jgi:hypothetical protein